MLRFRVVLVFAIALCVARVLDSVLTRRLVEAYGNGVKELNIFVDTGSVLSVFLSPLPVVVSLGALSLFAWMIYHPKVISLAYYDAGNSVSSILAKVLLGFPFLILAVIAAAVMQNASVWYFGGSLWPDAIRKWKVENPMLFLFSLVMAIDILFGRFFRKAMLGLLRRVGRSGSVS